MRNSEGTCYSTSPLGRFFIETYGCQMNRSDSTDLAAMLVNNGYQESDTLEGAEIVFINTCAVREHAEHKVYSRLGAIKKKFGKRFTIVVMGCLAQQEKSALIKKHPYIDLVVGTHQIAEIPALLEGKINASVLTEFEDYKFLKPYREKSIPFKALVNISHGCNNYCSYCVVPYVRGRETSRPSADIIRDIQELVDHGVVEVMLLGQNVNSYGKEISDLSFVELLGKINRIKDLKRIRFMTPHPKDFDPAMVDVIFDLEKVCPAIHLPLQSASDKILKEMNRKYTFAQYMDIVQAIRKKSEEIVLTTDILIGFPGETEDDFAETLAAIQDIRFDDAYTFKYSKRKFTKAFDLEDIVSEDDKANRLDRVILLQRAINIEITRQQIGKKAHILTEEVSEYGTHDFLSRTAGNRLVLVGSEGKELGKFYDVELTGVKGVTLTGK